MIPPSCHSNGFSEIYGTGQKVCNLDAERVSNVVFDNHPGGTGTNTRPDKRGWRAWMKRKTPEHIGGNVDGAKEPKEAMISTKEYPFWLYGNGVGGSADLTFRDVQVVKDGNPDTIHYIHEITDANGNAYKTNLTWTNSQLVRSGDHILFIYPVCDRLMFAQNLRLIGTYEGGDIRLDRSNASIAWYAPRIRKEFDPNEDTDIRPYRAPRTGVKGWEPNSYVLDPHPDEPYYSLRPGGEIVNPQYIHVETPPFGLDDWSDWRYNPKRASDIEDPASIRKPGLSSREIAILVKYAAKNEMSLQDAFTGRSLYVPAEGFEDAWYGSTVMLYGLSTEDIYEDPQNEQGYLRTECKTIFWTRDGSAVVGENAVEVSPANPSIWGEETGCEVLDALASRLLGNRAYPTPGIPPLLNTKNHHFDEDMDLWSAFDLRLFCMRYDWLAKPIKEDPRHVGHYIFDTSKPKRRGYFNTKCWASARQISPTPPRA